MTVEEVVNAPEFAQLSPGEQKFLQALAEGEDKLVAAKKAWSCKDNTSAAAQANRALRKIRRIRNRTILTQDEALGILSATVRQSTKPADIFKGVQIISDIRGWSKNPKASEDEEPKSIDELTDELENMK